jgi:hypothetical protein
MMIHVHLWLLMTAVGLMLLYDTFLEEVRCLDDTVCVKSLLCHKFRDALVLLLNFLLVADHCAQVGIFWTLVCHVAHLTTALAAKVFTRVPLNVDVIVIIVIS